MFLLVINDIEDILCTTDVHMKLFADDVKLYSSFSDMSCSLQTVGNKLVT